MSSSTLTDSRLPPLNERSRQCRSGTDRESRHRDRTWVPVVWGRVRTLKAHGRAHCPQRMAERDGDPARARRPARTRRLWSRRRYKSIGRGLRDEPRPLLATVHLSEQHRRRSRASVYAACDCMTRSAVGQSTSPGPSLLQDPFQDPGRSPRRGPPRTVYTPHNYTVLVNHPTRHLPSTLTGARRGRASALHRRRVAKRLRR